MMDAHPPRPACSTTAPVARRTVAVVVALASALLWALAVAPPSAADPTEPGGTFVDDDGSVHEGWIEAFAARGITRGCNPPTNDRFCPADPVTRSQLAAFLVREFGWPDGAGDDLFRDDDDSIFERDIDRLAAAGITRGCNPPTNDRFCPDDVVTRGQLAAFVVRTFGWTDGASADRFVDDDRSVFEGDIDRLAAAGATSGCNPPANDRFCPGDPVTREQLATILGRALGLTPTVPPPRPEPEGGGPYGTGGPLRTYSVEITDGLASRQPLEEFTAFVDAALGDPDRGWTSTGSVRLQRVADPRDADVRVLLASPSTVDTLCARAGLRTGGIYSCWNGEYAALNSMRWFGGVTHVPDLQLYRTYLVNHEVGHGIGHGHRSCPGAGRLAPVMMQLTKSTYGCVPNAWPHP